MSKIVPVLIALLVFTLNSGAASAADKKKEPTEQRKEMAMIHEKMAACLRSEKSMEDCHDEMRSSCRSTMGEDGCPMMGKRMKYEGKKRTQ